MKFVADVMLGKLARFLRMMGQDVLYFDKAEDEFLLYTCKETNRTLLTRDKELHNAARSVKVDSVLLASNYVKEQLRELLDKKTLKLAKPSRCIVCNGLLVKKGPEDVEGLIPEFVLHKNREFWMCSRCGKVYWDGSHVKNFVKFIGFNPWE
ncbi:conserved hypothetical protein [Thermosulfidibacter takaii ABI70S6]|uniref:Mut7-C RNAse domain-containing protein n=1 Tax=Thermosulfidibacter takaii (strain DSM 17441 / JCM 13301 / NBRC 103674 / ABI70S6) TaxID=1298851 RepID=A0A0S3QUV1_THET7|nr:Mut7-C RNAse domain-containing protein [Thermosulfidibacter takaii]BAT72125.1 conserved hypothetical protein [Thermosulfidibacter takaii ABI70S6]